MGDYTWELLELTSVSRFLAYVTWCCDFGLLQFVLVVFTFFRVADTTKKYAYHDWIVPKDRLDRDSNITSRPILSPITVGEGEALPPIARHRADKSPVSPNVTCYFINAWLSIVILAGAYAGGNNNQLI